ncbi:hypothetical protein EIN_281710 [Entamoeba invadens IP1]|uniref:Uncharacterized protein n=1 Tax=Entamoeba invadens IP1 TaxID=370355 RepID=A0A0A1TWY5_ENTIV|nr:hypothetical protein EIN_281710 [Entamoeba invadens IP1]ELP85800.1 hypothetical protein EIN_281710 [Entamoeba invadens IP1]|eukprot:XP_004185146.1 hypothetical protein EIN_281710 [Entamoeba invadens IP1]
MFIFLIVTLALSQDKTYCEVDTVATLTEVTETCVKNGWTVDITPEETHFVLSDTNTNLTLELSGNAINTIDVGLTEICPIKTLIIDNTVASTNLYINLVNIENVDVYINGTAAPTTVYTAGVGQSLINFDSFDRQVLFDFDEEKPISYVEATGSLSFAFTMTKAPTSEVCEPRIIAPSDAKPIEYIENGRVAQKMCTLKNDKLRYGVCPDGIAVTEDCTCYYTNNKFSSPDCLPQGENYDLTVDGVLVIDEDAHFKSVKFTEDYGRIVVNNGAVLTIDKLYVSEYFLLFGDVNVDEMVVSSGATKIDGYGDNRHLKVNNVTKLTEGRVYFLSNIDAPTGLKKTCVGKFEMGLSRYVATDDDLECECHSTNGDVVEEDCVVFKRGPNSPYNLIVDGTYKSEDDSYWTNIDATDKSVLSSPSLYSKICNFGAQIVIGGKVSCDKITGEDLTVSEETITDTIHIVKSEESVGNTFEFKECLLSGVLTLDIPVTINSEVLANTTILKKATVTATDITLKNVVAGNNLITITETCDSVVLDSIVMTKTLTDTTVDTFLVVDPADVPLQITLNAVTGEGLVAINKYRELNVTDLTLSCANQALTVGTLECNEMGLETSICYAVDIGVFNDENGERVYNCPCDNTIEKCTLVITENYIAQNFVVEKEPSAVIVKKGTLVLETKEFKFDISAQKATTGDPMVDVDPIVSISGEKNVLNIPNVTTPLTLSLSLAQKNDLTSTGVALFLVEKDGYVEATTASEGCTNLAIEVTAQCSVCTETLELINGKCVVPSQSSSAETSEASSEVSSDNSSKDSSETSSTTSEQSKGSESASKSEDSKSASSSESGMTTGFIVAITVLSIFIALIFIVVVVLITLFVIKKCKKSNAPGEASEKSKYQNL